MKRRDFLKAAGATGLFILFHDAAQAAPQLIPTRPAGYPMDFNAYLRIAPDGRVGCFVGKVEMGQGNMTSLAMLAAEELDVPLDRVDMLMGDTDLCPWDGGTGGSLSIWQFGPVLRGAAAEARAVLLLMAGEHLRVPVDRLEVKAGVVSVKGDPARQVGYGQLVQGKRIERHLAGVRPKPVSAYTLVGRSAPRKDALDKVTGAARYSADQGLPGTLHACIVRPPAHGATLKSADTSAAERMPGVRVLREGSLVAVLHPFPDQARKALGLVKASFEGAPRALDDRTIYPYLAGRAATAKVGVQDGDLKAGEARAATLVEGDYLNAYVAHAALEPHSAVAQWKEGRMTVWAGVQAPFRVKAQVAEALGLPAQKVRIITPEIGGAFGGKSAGPQAVEAARLAMKAGAPVQVVWDRREEFFLDTFRPAAVVKIRSGLDQAGRITFWDCQVSGTSDREAEIGYELPAKRFSSTGDSGDLGTSAAGLHPFPTGAWRAPAANTNVFARESHMDVLAARARIDPLAFRLRHLTDRRVIRVLEAAAERFGWVPGVAPSGRGVGLACGSWRGTLTAAMAELVVDRPTGQVRVKRVVLAQDMGLVINPDGARQQMEGAVTMGLGYALSEGLRFKDGRILDENFDTYRIPRFSWIPAVETVLVDNPGLEAQGGGEPPIVCMGAVLANAIFDAVGARMFELPMTPERILEALRKS
ncbi:MAG: molybdopterin-dependent oxidoreductase [Holophaga sp.]|nr:molybdopterin-dependent oxidoreductase [Holophaga sp.]